MYHPLRVIAAAALILCAGLTQSLHYEDGDYVEQLERRGDVQITLERPPERDIRYVDGDRNTIPENTAHNFTDGLKLDLGAGFTRRAGFVSVDRIGSPDVLLDLETFPWPWEDDSVSEVYISNLLCQIGETSQIYFKFMQELYRVCKNSAVITIVVPHPRHSVFLNDPTNVRPITNAGLQLLSRYQNKYWVESGASNTPLALFLEVDFSIDKLMYSPSDTFYEKFDARIKAGESDMDLLRQYGPVQNDLIDQVTYWLVAIKHHDEEAQ